MIAQAKPLPGAGVSRGGAVRAGLVGAWLLSERSGVIANNSGSFGAVANGVITNTANTNSHWTGSLYGSGLDTLNNTRYVTLSNFPYIKFVSIVSWVKTTVSGSYYEIVNRDLLGARTWQFRVDPDGKLTFIPFNSGGFNGNTTSSIAINDGKWHQVVGTWDGGNERVYIDGKRSGTPGTLSGVLPTYNNPFFIAQGSFDGGLGITAIIDHVYIYNRALGAGEVAYLYSHPFAPFASLTPRLFAPATAAFKPAWASRANQLITPGVI